MKNNETKQKTMLIQTPSMEKCAIALNQNAENSVRFIRFGQELIRRAEHEGMDEGMADEIRSYNSQCASQIKAMHELRRPFTEILADQQKRFVSLENAIDPRKPGTPAHTCGQYLDSFLRDQMDEAFKQRERLEKNLRQTQRRIEGRQDLSEEEKRTALERADKRRLLGERDLSLRAIDSELIPEPLSPEGYMVLLAFWWENRGKGMPDDELRKTFHPILMYAKAQARKGILVDSPHVSYLAEPKRKKTA